jgi:crotonobetaine/carnitine-CoA ligase
VEAVRERDGRRWLRTGDLGLRDAGGWYYYAGRAKDSVRRRGINISAWEVERVINEHPDVEESALVGVPGELGEDELLIYIRPAGGRTIDPAALVAWCEPQRPLQVRVTWRSPRLSAPTQRIRKSELSRAVASLWTARRPLSDEVTRSPHHVVVRPFRTRLHGDRMHACASDA